MIEGHSTDTPFPSVLGVATVNGRPLHVVWGLGPARMRTLLTTYQPDPARWDAAFRVRKRKE